MFNRVLRSHVKKRIKAKKILELKNRRDNPSVKLPMDLLKYTLFGFLNYKDKAIISRTSKQMQKHLAFKVTTFIHHVAYGEEVQATAMLRRLMKSQDAVMLNHLLSTKIAVTDIAGKQFEPITAFQYAVWALDWHMWQMLQKYMPKTQQKAQLAELEKIGVCYKKPALNDEKEERISGEKHFDLTPLIAALRDFAYQYRVRGGYYTSSDNTMIWCKKVGGAERQVPAHVAQEFCYPGRAFIPRTPTFQEDHLPRTLEFRRCFGKHSRGYLAIKLFFNARLNSLHQKSSWYADPGLGVDFAIEHTSTSQEAVADRLPWSSGNYFSVPYHWDTHALAKFRNGYDDVFVPLGQINYPSDFEVTQGMPELLAMEALYKQRKQDLAALKNELQISSIPRSKY